jgi:ribosomal protein S8
MIDYYISNLLINIKNGYVSNLRTVYCRYNVTCVKILALLYKGGYIDNYYFTKTGLVVIKLKYYWNTNLFNGLKIYSKPGRKIYYSSFDLYCKFNKLPFVVVSTSCGLLNHKDAILKNLGGEVLFSLNYL